MMETQNISSQPSSHDERPLPPLPAEYESSPVSSEYQSSALPVWQLHLHRDLNTNLTTTNSTLGVNAATELRHRKATSILRNRISMSIVPHRTSSQSTAEFVADDFFRSSKNDMYTLRSTTTLLKSEQCQGFGLSSTTNDIILPRSAKTAQLLLDQSTGNPLEYTSNSHSSPNSPNAFRLFHTPTTVESESQPRAMENREPVIPRWQPDAEVTYCPICQSQFNFFVRKHHCRKCGRVVCNSCSPHRITIPHQFIISPPEVGYTSSSTTAAPSRTLNSTQVTDHGGGERVRLCNPCVTDPNNTPAQSIPELDEYYRRSSRSSQSSHRQSASTSTLAPNFPIGSQVTSKTIEPMAVSDSRHPQQHNYLTQRSRNSRPSNPPYGASHGRRERGFRAGNIGNRSRSSTIGAFRAVNNSQSDDLAHNPPIMFQSGHDMRPLPHLPRSSRRQISEDDECWVCHGELPSRNLENYETLRADHVKRCINSAIESTSGSARNSSVFSQTDETATLNNTGSTSTENNYHQRSHNTNSFPVPRKHIGIFSYKATEKDQIDNAECTICLEEFEAGQDMGRLECFCRFHLKCIRGWFEMRPGQCPVHQHDRAY